MKQIVILLASFILSAQIGFAQQASKRLDQNRVFTGAKATKKSYHVIYQLDSNDPKIIEKAFRNINNALNDIRLAGKLEVELVAFSGGTEALLNSSKYEADLKSIIEKGVLVVQCNNSLQERKISRDQLYDFIGIVPSANGELILRQAEGWSVIKP